MTTAKEGEKAAEKKSTGKKASDGARSGTSSKKATDAVGSMPKEGKDPKGGLTAAGRKYFKEKEGLNLRPGVKGPADTPEKMLRKGSFLRRHYAHPRGPVVDEKGEPTRQALQAAAWGEPVPNSGADEKRLAEKGSELLERYHEAKGDALKKGERADAGARPEPKKREAKKTARKKKVE